MQMEVTDHELLWKDHDVCEMAVIERHGRDNHIALGFSVNSGIETGACASSYSHDSHDLIVMGRNEEDILNAINRVIELQGGIVVSCDEKIMAEIALPVAGLLSKRSVEDTAADFVKVRKAFDEIGYRHFNNVMNFTLLSLTCIPTLKLTDRGYLNTVTMEQPELFEEI